VTPLLIDEADAALRVLRAAINSGVRTVADSTSHQLVRDVDQVVLVGQLIDMHNKIEDYAGRFARSV
jgi:hypothetical protein